MLIVLEGVDRGGKTTLANRLADAHGRDRTLTLHQGPPPPRPADLTALYERPLLEQPLRSAIDDPDRLVILDRWETGELVYGPILRGESRLSHGQALHVQLLLRSLGAVRVLAQPDDVNAVLDRHFHSPDGLVSVDCVEEIHGFYEGYAARNDWLRAETTAGTERGYDVAQLLERAAVASDGARSLADFPGYLGPRWPVALLVGERRSSPKRNPDPTPWTLKPFGPYGKNSCGQWLLDRLDEIGSTRVGLANAHEPGQDLVALWERLDSPPTVSLGGEASAELRRLGLFHTRVAHPQWAKRFKHKEPGWYADRLQEAMKR